MKQRKKINIIGSYCWFVLVFLLTSCGGSESHNDNFTIGTVLISGNAFEDQTLTVSNTLYDSDGISSAIKYQWNCNGFPIDGATSTTYTLTIDDVGCLISVTANYTDSHGINESVTSDSTAVVAHVNHDPTGSVIISGNLYEKEILTVSNTLSDSDGLSETINYQWYRNGNPISNAIGKSYLLNPADNYASISVIASYTDDLGVAESIESNVTTAIIPVNEVMAIWSNSDIFLNTSINSGISWDGAALLKHSTGDIEYHNPHAASDGKGNIIVVWETKNNLMYYNGDYEIFYVRSNDNGVTWSDPVPLNSNARIDIGNDLRPRISTNGNGRWIVAWHSNSDIDGRLGTDYDIIHSISDDNGTNWTAPVALNTPAYTDDQKAFDMYPLLVNDGGNNWLLVWQYDYSYAGPAIIRSYFYYSYSKDNGNSWSNPIILSELETTSLYADGCSLDMDSEGNAILTWHSGSGYPTPEYDIKVAISSNCGVTWSTVSTIHENTNTIGDFNMNPCVAMDNSGNAAVVWSSREDLNTLAGTDYDIFTAYTNDYGASWSSPQILNEDYDSDIDDEGFPCVITDSQGKWMAIWQDSMGQIYTSYSNNKGSSWNSNTNVVEGISSSNEKALMIVY